MKRVAVWIALVIVLSGCGAGAYAVKSGEVTDYITNTESRQNGFYIVWMRTDVTAAYCTADAEMYKQAQDYRESVQLVTISYKGINSGDADAPTLGLFSTGCDPSDGENTRTYRLVSIAPAGGQ